MTRTTKKTPKPTKTAKPAPQPTRDARAEALGIVEALAAHGLEQAELDALASSMPPRSTLVDLMRRGLDALDAKRAAKPADLHTMIPELGISASRVFGLALASPEPLGHFEEHPLSLPILRRLSTSVFRGPELEVLVQDADDTFADYGSVWAIHGPAAEEQVHRIGMIETDDQGGAWFYDLPALAAAGLTADAPPPATAGATPSTWRGDAAKGAA